MGLLVFSDERFSKEHILDSSKLKEFADENLKFNG